MNEYTVLPRGWTFFTNMNKALCLSSSVNSNIQFSSIKKRYVTHQISREKPQIPATIDNGGKCCKTRNGSQKRFEVAF